MPVTKPLHHQLANTSDSIFRNLFLRKMSKRKATEQISKANKKKVRQYSVEYLKFGFVSDITDPTKPYCLSCRKSFCNDSMRPVKLEEHFKNAHPEHKSKPLDYFKAQRDKANASKSKEQKVDSMFKTGSTIYERGLYASYELSFLLAKHTRPHTDGEHIIKPAIQIYLRTMQENKRPTQELNALPLSNDTVRRRIDEIGDDLESQLVSILQKTKFSLALDESTVRDSECLLLGYARFIHDSEFVEEMLFCKSMTTTTTAQDIYSVVKNYLTEKNIPILNIVSTAADGAPTMMGHRNGVLKLLKDDNPDMITVHCVVHRENLAAQGLTPQLHEIMKSVIKVVNFIKAHPKTERLFKEFCKDMEEEYIRLLLHTQVRWLSKGKCLERFIALYDSIVEFGGEREVFQFLHCDNSKSLICYLTDIFTKLNALNRELQGTNKTLMDCKTKISGFINKLKFMKSQIVRGDLSQFTNLSKCDASEDALLIISTHLNALAEDFTNRFADLKSTTFPAWITQPFLFDSDSEEIQTMDSDLRDELLDFQNDDSMHPVHKVKGQLLWMDSQVAMKYPKLAALAQQTLLPFPTTYLVECAFSAVTDLLTNKRGSLNISIRGDLRAKLTSFKPQIASLVSQHESQGSH